MAHTTLEIARAMRHASDLLVNQDTIPGWLSDIIDEGERELSKHDEVMIATMLDAGAV